MSRLNHPVYRNRVLQVAADAVLVALAYFLAFQLRFLDQPHGWPHRYEVLFAQSVGFVVVGKLVVFAAFGLYQKWWRYVSGRDFLLIFRAVAVSSALLVVVFAVAKPFAHTLPRSVEVIDFLLTLILVAGARLAVRLIVERPSRGSRLPKHEVLVVGAGSGGQMVVRELQLNPNLGASAIGFVDDDPRKRGMRMLGLKVLGSTRQIDKILDETAPDEVVIAIPSAPGDLRGRIVAACRDREIRVRTLPTVFELLRGGVQLNKQLREVRVEDVLGREPIVRELDRVGAYLRDRIVLVTGAGGSIGSELCRQIAQVKPRLLVMLDHAEDNLFEIDREMVEMRHFASCESVLADCKEPHRMLEVMQRFKPDV
ncbi:MAG: polysaccharide biosynthesis protein, partial [Solirubrobacterales bacterium]